MKKKSPSSKKKVSAKSTKKAVAPAIKILPLTAKEQKANMTWLKKVMKEADNQSAFLIVPEIKGSHKLTVAATKKVLDNMCKDLPEEIAIHFLLQG